MTKTYTPFHLYRRTISELRCNDCSSLIVGRTSQHRVQFCDPCKARKKRAEYTPREQSFISCAICQKGTERKGAGHLYCEPCSEEVRKVRSRRIRPARKKKIFVGSELRNCTICSKAFGSTKRSQKFCSRRCAASAQKKEARPCFKCGNPTKTRRAKYCHACAVRPQVTPLIHCLYCREQFRPRRNQQFCGRECHKLSLRMSLPSCKNCGEQIPWRRGGKSRQFCSFRCCCDYKIKRRTGSCEICGSSFHRRSGNNRFCSRKCFGLSIRVSSEQKHLTRQKTLRTYSLKNRELIKERSHFYNQRYSDPSYQANQLLRSITQLEGEHSLMQSEERDNGT